MRKLMVIELNEVNFNYVRSYVARGALPHLGKLIRDHGITPTTSEQAYDDLEPWIQWVSAHTGLSRSEHGVFRLGDIVDRPDVVQIWEVLERAGITVGAISPMNARNACRSPAFFVPDPWTRTPVSGGTLMRNLHQAIAQLVNDNAHGRVEKSSLAWLAAAMMRYANPTNYGQYRRLALATKKPWSRALLLDLLLSDLFSAELKRSNADFATLFLNAAAHIQHHYLFNSSVYDGPNNNPSWYAPADQDPLLEVYSLYDRIIGSLLTTFPDRRMLLATGLHQDPYPTTLMYWRLRDHAAFLAELGVPCEHVEARMSRDFVVFCHDVEEAREAERLLKTVAADDGQPLFDIDNRGDSLFVMLVYGAEIKPGSGYRMGNRSFEDLSAKTAFVAIKNGEHNGIGYLVDSDDKSGDHAAVPLTSLFDRVIMNFDLLKRSPIPNAA